jgi:cytochrome c biogenesis protein CcdA
MNRWFLYSIGIAVALWIGVTLFERSQNKRKLENLQRRIRKREGANAERDEET